MAPRGSGGVAAGVIREIWRTTLTECLAAGVRRQTPRVAADAPSPAEV